MVDTVTQTFNLLHIDSKRLYRKRRDDQTSTYSSTNSTTSNPNDWHRLLLARLKPGMSGKYRMTTRNGNKLDTSLSTSMDDSTVTLQSFSDDSSIVDYHQINLMESDASKYFDSSNDNIRRKDNRFVKNYMANRYPDHITSLKRRVRKQQMRHFQRRPTIVQETTYQLPTSHNVLIMSYPEQHPSTRRFRQKKLNGLVTLPPVPNPRRTTQTHTHGFKLNLFGC